jgi:hypothetical protein
MLPGLILGEPPTATRESQLALRIELRQARKVEAPETSREDADRQKEMGATRHPARPIRSYPPGGQDTMQVGVMVELLAPGVQHGETADLRPKMLGSPAMSWRVWATVRKSKP